MRPYDVVMWTWKLSPLVGSAWLTDRTFTGYSPRVLVLCVTIIILKVWHVMEPQGRSGLVRKAAFWSHVLVLSFQGYLIAIESDNAAVLPERFTVAFGFVMLTILTYILVSVGWIIATGRVIWRGPPLKGKPGKRGLYTKSKNSSYSAKLWIQDYVRSSRRLAFVISARGTGGSKV